jgi:hypothetical protein
MPFVFTLLMFRSEVLREKLAGEELCIQRWSGVRPPLRKKDDEPKSSAFRLLLGLGFVVSERYSAQILLKGPLSSAIWFVLFPEQFAKTSDVFRIG